MKALLWREFYLIRKQLKMALVMFVGYWIIFSRDQLGGLPMALWLVMIFVPIMVYSSVYRDDQTGWYGHAVASGVSRRTVLWSQYLLFDLLLVAAVVICWLNLLWHARLGDGLVPVLYLRGLFYYGMACVFVYCVIPIVLCLGAERSHWAVLGLAVGIFFIGLVTVNMNGAWKDVLLPVAQYWRPVLILLAVAVAGQAISFPLTLMAFQKKEL